MYSVHEIAENYKNDARFGEKMAAGLLIVNNSGEEAVILKIEEGPMIAVYANPFYYTALLGDGSKRWMPAGFISGSRLSEFWEAAARAKAEHWNEVVETCNKRNILREVDRQLAELLEDRSDFDISEETE